VQAAMEHSASTSVAATLPLDDLALARRIAGGDRAGFDVLMRRNNRRLFRLARAALRNDAEAEEALQEVYIAVYRGIARFRGESTLATWLSRLVLNECAERLRKDARRQNAAPTTGGDGVEEAHDDEHDRPEQLLMRAEMRALLERKVDALPKDFRIVFMLRSVEELSVEETADVLGLDPATVRTRHFRARGLLREALAREIDIAGRDLFDFAGTRCDRIVATVNTRLDT
jgi:RNA polymerase sigma-70 factor (ECF subfamily)